MTFDLRKALMPLLAAIVYSTTAHAQVISDRPVVYSQTMIAIVPGTTVPKTLTQSPMLQTPTASQENSAEALIAEAIEEEGNEEDAEAETEGATEEVKQMLTEQASKTKLRVQVRGNQIPIDQGMYHNYTLDENHAVLTYFADASERSIVAENIQKPLDMLFVKDDGIIAQIIPEVVPAYLSEEIEVAFALRALLYVEAGYTEKMGIQPGYRIEHGMFKPKPLIYTAPKEEE